MSHSEESARIAELMDSVKLSRNLLGRFPAELSGGQKQRVALARAFGVQPSLLLCDEATSSLDVSVQATIIELINELASRHNAAVIFVSHDFAVVRNIADRVMVMREGVSCEEGSVEDVFRYPNHSYTKELLAAIPDDHLASFGVTG
jgi:peptide/nickel transport system ATP-binding protein